MLTDLPDPPDTDLSAWLRAELRRALDDVRAGANARERFRSLASLAGSLVAGGNARVANDVAVDALLELHTSGRSEDDLLRIVWEVALAHRAAIEVIKQRLASRSS